MIKVEFSGFSIRVTAVITSNKEILLVKQYVNNERQWSLPGGRVNKGESLKHAIEREVMEETGLKVECGELLYVCEKPNESLLHITFITYIVGGKLTLPTNEYDRNQISDVKYFNFDSLLSLGFKSKFVQLLKSNFPNKGAYKGLKDNIGL